MKPSRLIPLLAALAFAVPAAAAPVVANVRAAQRPGTHLVDIYYDATDAAGLPLTVIVLVSADGGATWNVPAVTLTGAAGSGVAAGLNHQIVWDAGVDWPGQFTSQCRVRVLADDGSGLPAPAGMVYVPPGAFQMGDNLDSETDAQPVHNVFVSAFFMDKNLVSGLQWVGIYNWAVGHGYTFEHAGSWYAPNHPVQTINWYDVVKWCNARSEMEGRTPCYYTNAAQTTVYRTGDLNLTNGCVKWNANGYRLPTEAEWEKAARGGLVGKRYPWGDTINGSDANYAGSGDPFEKNNPPSTPVGYYNGNQTPAGVDMANGYGLYDMAGNVSEWCWDCYSPTYYGDATALNDPHGPPWSYYSERVLRGGSWAGGASYCRSAMRDANNPSPYMAPYQAAPLGFRSVLALGQP